MTTQAFADAVAKGVGRAVLVLTEGNSHQNAEAIETACLICQKYDPLCEDGRAPYLMQLVERAGLRERILAAILSQIGPNRESDWRQRLVREFALNRLQVRPLPFWSLSGLLSSYRPEDKALISDALTAAVTEEDDLRHDLGMDLLRLLEKWPSIHRFQFCLWIYEHGPCSMCRRSSVMKMVAAGCLPEDIRRDAAYDADEEARQAVSSL